MSIKSISEAYSILEVHSSASQSEVKSAYKRLALRTHPDKNANDPSANAKFQQVTEAFQMLMNLRYEPLDDNGDFSSEVNAEDFFGEDFANIIFRFVFSGGRASSSFNSRKPQCNCVDCQFERFFSELNRGSGSESKPQPEVKKGVTSTNVASPSARVSQTRDATSAPRSDPHADWLSEAEGEAKASGPMKGKKSSRKKKKNKRNAAKQDDETPEKEESGERAVGRLEEDSLEGGEPIRPESDARSSDSDISSVSNVTAGAHTPPTSSPPSSVVNSQWKASPVPNRRIQAKNVRKSVETGTGLPAISTTNNPRKFKKSRAPHTPNAGYKQHTPRTPSSVASTHVGSYSAPNTPAQAHQAHSPQKTPITTSAATAVEDRASSSPRKAVKTSTTKQGYTNPNLPSLEGVQLCRIFLLKHGKCRFGDKCKFSHGVAPGTVLAASDTEEGVFASPCASPERSTPSSDPSPSPREAPTLSVPVTMSPQVQRGTGRAQVIVNPSIGGFGRKSAPRPPPSQRFRTARVSAAGTETQKPNGAGEKVQQGPGLGQSQAQHHARGAVQGKVKANIYESAFGDSEESAGGPARSEAAVCAFYNTPSGCRNGQSCRFKHSAK